MKNIAAVLVVTSSLVPGSAHALDLRPSPGPIPVTFRAGLIACDNGFDYSSFVQDDSRRFGNEFHFPANAQLSRVEFVHKGYEILHGPYLFDIELWDPETCTFIDSADHLVAGDAFGGSIIEGFDLCPEGLSGSGRVAVVLDANSCYAPGDCYPALELDNTDRDCHWIITPALSSCVFFPGAGDFLLRIELDACPTGAARPTWGSLKQRYR